MAKADLLCVLFATVACYSVLIISSYENKCIIVNIYFDMPTRYTAVPQNCSLSYS